MIQKSAQNLKDEEFLAILLGTGIEGKNVIEIAKQILNRYSKKRLLKLIYNDLSKVKGIGPSKACTILAATELVKRVLKIGEEILQKLNQSKMLLLKLFI